MKRKRPASHPRSAPPRAGAGAALARLERMRAEFGGEAANTKLGLLRALDRATLTGAAQVLRLHDVLCFLRAYPDEARLLSSVDRMLARFTRRADFRRYREALENSGIAGTTIRFRFFEPTAGWLARRWPANLSIDWPELEDTDLLEAVLPLLAHPAESAALDELDLPLREWIARMKSPRETDGAFLARRFQTLPMADAAREILYDRIDAPLVLAPGRDTPSRTHARAPVRSVAFQARPLARERPDLRVEAMRAPLAVQTPGPAECRRLLDLARASMVTRQRDLDAFAYGDARDVRLIQFPNGLSFAAIGVRPSRRLLLEAVYGFLTLQNGVPIGYVLASALFGSAEIAYNVFETWRGVEAATVYGRVASMLRHLFHVDTFTIYPYQLGQGNDEALSTGAWWFYRKLGFSPHNPTVARLMRSEERRMEARPGARSSVATLKQLARESLPRARNSARRHHRSPGAPERRPPRDGVPGATLRIGTCARRSGHGRRGRRVARGIDGIGMERRGTRGVASVGAARGGIARRRALEPRRAPSARGGGAREGEPPRIRLRPGIRRPREAETRDRGAGLTRALAPAQSRGTSIHRSTFQLPSLARRHTAT